MIQIRKVIISLLLLAVNCKQETKITEDQISIKDVISQEKFEEGSGMHYLALKFNQNGLFEFIYSSEGWDWETKGQYSISENRVILKALPCPDSSDSRMSCSNNFNDGVCSIRPSTNGIEYQYTLACLSSKKFVIFSQDSEPSNEIAFDIKKYPFPDGSPRKYNGFDIVTLGNKSATVKEPVVLREGPGIDYPKLEYVVNVYDGPRYPSLPKGEIVTVHARTAQKQKVKTWENYWLLISIQDTKYAWAYAEFFK